VAAVAFLHGRPPLEYLALDPLDAVIAAEVIRRARQIELERRVADTNNLAQAIRMGREVVIVNGD
jgi:hypothetical protein